VTPLPCRLDEYDRTEWLGIMRKVRPDLSDEEFSKAWDEFQRLKALRAMQ
jgi:hypothetical protein